MTSLLVLLDLSAAFDTVDHNLLIENLYCYCVRNGALLLLKSYLSDRSQRVVVGNTISDPLLCGVPQGSVLGPVLFTVYTSSLSFLLDAHGVAHHLYADDTQLYVKIENINETKMQMESLLLDVNLWMLKRKLKLKDNKTEIIIIRGNRRINYLENDLSLNIGGHQLDSVSTVRNLGVHFNSKLNYEENIKQVVKVCNFHIRNLYSVRRFLNKRCLLSLIHSAILSRVDYCNVLWVGLPNYLLKKVQTILNRTARLIFNLPPGTPTTPYLIELHWLPIKARIEFKLCLLIFKALKFGEPDYLADLLRSPAAHSGAIRRSNDDALRLEEPVAVHQSSFANRSFSHVAPELYNKLPLSMRQFDSVELFKKQLKTQLFTKSYDLVRGSVTEIYQL
ncbi:hypothetical protein Pcinc_016955 [Petrolisthes cinctipes]|uniref:Reverse transcriptase domain-containing protein n=1 Tax=Petrolisthes cinctipes TaxID=88211 RepID=A0AAE1FRM7_PETCI|nr:hypothetical protein Pcinc_016955 [Petrolisthes cinctipes]